MSEKVVALPAGARTVEIKTSDQAIHQAPVIYVDGAQSLIANDQLVKFNLFQDRLIGGTGETPEVPIERVVCARLVMSALTFRQLADWIADNHRRLFQETDQN